MGEKNDRGLPRLFHETDIPAIFSSSNARTGSQDGWRGKFTRACSRRAWLITPLFDRLHSAWAKDILRDEQIRS